MWIAGAARPSVREVLAGWNAHSATLHELSSDQWIRVGADSVRVELVDMPDYPATPVVYVPSLRWAYAWPSGPVPADWLRAYARRRGWNVTRIGTARRFVTPITP